MSRGNGEEICASFPAEEGVLGPNQTTNQTLVNELIETLGLEQGDCVPGEVEMKVPANPYDPFSDTEIGTCIERDRLPLVFTEANRLREGTGIDE
jgi:hypothetical protein